MLLLDTHVLLWWLANDRRLGKKARAAIRRRDELVFVSAASLWEIAIKAGLGRLKLEGPPETWLPPELERHDFRDLPVTGSHALAVGELPKLHGDPFDRMLIAQGREERMTLVTADERVLKYPVDLLDATV
ncbi:MAG: type II toxin-antitoxin system VapC family toxin [bacterium]|nr:type II toxin-antitoxin system VapC family toxin [bacterium]